MKKNLLAIDSTNDHLSVGLFDGSSLLSKETGEFKKSSANVIFELINTLLMREKKNFLT